MTPGWLIALAKTMACAMLITLGWFTEHGRVAERVPHIWERDGLRFLTELSDSTTAELTWMLDETR